MVGPPMVCKIVPRNRLVLDIVSVCFYAIEDIEAVVCEKQEWPCCTYRAFVQIFVFYAGQDGIRYYQRMVTNKLDQRLGAENPFEHIWTRGGQCSDISIGDWDGDGDLDVLQTSPLSPTQYFEQSEGQLLPLEGPKSPFYELANQTVTHRPS